MIQNIVATDATLASSITGIPGRRVEHVTLSDLRVLVEGGGGPELVKRQVPEKESSYPDAAMFGALPALGLYVRHARGVVVRNLDVSAARPDARTVLTTEDVERIETDGVRLEGEAVAGS